VPYANIKITNEDAAPEKKAELIAGERISVPADAVFNTEHKISNYSLCTQVFEQL
jgi:hypothetical protein